MTTITHKKVPARSGDTVRVIGGLQAPRALYDEVATIVSGRISKLTHDRLYRLQEICGDERWDSLGNAWVKRMAGRCFAHMVSTRRFPFSFVQYKRYATKRYQLKPDIAS